MFKMDKLKLTLIIVSSALIISMGYILTEKVNFCETTKNESYALGFNQGRESWNMEVMIELNNNNVIPYWFNQTRYELPISQLCGV